jgi:hypothetical protein
MFQEGIWASGFLVGAAWGFCNFYFLFRLIKMSFEAGTPKPKIFRLLMIKFPVLYLAGFYILRTGFFPVLSIVAGFSAYFFILAALWVYFKKEIA